MEQNNLTNKNEEKVEPLVSKGEQISDLKKPQESFKGEDKEVSVVDDVEEVLKIQAEVQKLETQVQSTLDGVNQINENLGLPPKKVEEIPSLQNKIAKIFNLKSLLRAATFTGLMIGATSEGLSQTNQDNYKNIDNKEVVTNSEKYLLKLKEFNIVSQEMSSKEFQEIAKDKEKMKKINDEYTKASGIISVHSEEYKKLQEKKPETIKVTVYHIDESQEKKFANKEYTKKDRKEDIENIWEKVKKGELQYGDIVVLRNGERYEIKDYKPGSFNKAKGSILEEGEKVVTTNNTLPMEDYVGRD